MQTNKITSVFLKYMLPAFLLAFTSMPSHAAKFGVRVVSPSGEPIAGAAVCIGTHGNYKQFGALFTSASGDVIIDVPPVPLVVTVSKNRFSGVRLAEPARRFNLVKTVKLQDGIPGPRCRAGSSLASADDWDSNLKIRNVNVRDDVFNVRLVPEVSGNVNRYRLATNRAMRNATWKKLSSNIPVDARFLGETVYLQVARVMSTQGASIESRSNVFPVDLQGL